MFIDVEKFKPKSISHILNGKWNDSYGVGFRNVITNFLKLIDSHKKLNSLKSKLLISTENLLIQQQNQFIQAASELTAVNYFLKEFPKNFKYEPKLNKASDSNVECQFEFNNYIYNIEVKASSYLFEEDSNNDKLKVKIKGHLGNYKKLFENIQNFLPNIELDKRYENNLKSHLLSAQNKFPHINNSKFCNVLIIACNNSDDLQNHYDYLFAKNSFFTESSFVNHSEFDLVDIVFLTNLFYQHNFNENQKINDSSWHFEKSFIIGFRNPFRRDVKNEKLNLIETIIPNWYKSFRDYKGGPDFIKLKHFIHSELGMTRKIFYYN